MIIANYNNKRCRAEEAGSGAQGTCPFTGLEVRARVGEIRQFWAYVGGAPNLPRGYEPETEWHVAWKTPIQDDYCEVIFGPNNEHRADILGANQTVIEIQHSIIDIRDVRERIGFYLNETRRRVIWVVDIRSFWKKTFDLDFKKSRNGIIPVIWKPRRMWLYHIAQTLDTNLFLEFNTGSDKLIQMWVHGGALKAQFVTKREFFMRYLDQVSKPEFRDYSEKNNQLWDGL